MARRTERVLPRRSLLARIARADEALYGRLARTESRTLDTLMPALSRAADYSILWFISAATMRASGRRRAQRAARRGMLSVAVTSLVTNQLLKRLHFRPRPNSSVVTARRLAHRMPVSSSFPSGHSASAAAFATAVALEHAPLGATLGVLAAGVGVSRVATGAHYPSDVVAGWAVGAGIAALGARIVPPVAAIVPDEYVPDQHRVTPLPRGAGLHIVANDRSGSDDASAAIAAVSEQLPEAVIFRWTADGDLVELVEQAAAGAAALGAMGGDGTVNAVADVAARLDLPLAVFPAGTFNHFAKDGRILSIDDTVQAVVDGVASRADAARINDRLFLNTASIGTYPEFVTERDRYEPRFGKRLAAAIATYQVFRRSPTTHLRVNGEDVQALMFFVGNGQYQPVEFAPAMRPRLDDGLLDVRIIRGDVRYPSIRLIASILAGRFGRSPLYRQMSVPSVDIEVLDEDTLLSRDGELDPYERHLRFTVQPVALQIFQPASPGL